MEPRQESFKVQRENMIRSEYHATEFCLFQILTRMTALIRFDAARRAPRRRQSVTKRKPFAFTRSRRTIFKVIRQTTDKHLCYFHW